MLLRQAREARLVNAPQQMKVACPPALAVAFQLRCNRSAAAAEAQDNGRFSDDEGRLGC